MNWPVTAHPDVEHRLERLVLPDDALADGQLVTPPGVAATARRRRALFDGLTARLGQDPHDARLGTVAARLPGRRGAAYASTLQDPVEACHVWWHWQGLNSSIEVLDIAYTPRLDPGPTRRP